MNLPQNLEIVLAVLLAGVGIALVVTVFAYVVIPIFKGIGWLIVHIFTFVGREIGDTFRAIGGVITTVVFVPLVLMSIVVGRWSSAAHYGRAIQSEIGAIASAIYRVAIGNPVRLFCMSTLLDGIEQRLPAAMAAAPGADRPNKARTGQFDGYKIVGSLPGGGSGGRLFVAEPDELKKAAFLRNNLGDIRQVVIKTFSLRDGSSLPQIVRESRALEAAKKLGLVLDHELTDERFFYIMRYVPGESLGLVTQRLHAQTGGSGLGAAQLRSVLGYAADLLTTLDQYHRGGLWHKDVKPDNIIVDGRHAHLVDFGLVTPLRSGMTLTTHGTEYFRDPEMVRMALKGVKVHEVDGAKFDLYAAGAVLFSMIENSFPAHGGLSQLTRPCPEAVRWIIRRAMADYDKRYGTASMMMADLGVVLASSDPNAVKPADLPSMREGGAVLPIPETAPAMHTAVVNPHIARPSFDPAPVPVPVPAAPGQRPRLRVTNWWLGRYESDSGPHVVARADSPVLPASPVGFNPEPDRRSAVQQLSSARERARAARERAHARLNSRRRPGGAPKEFKSGPNAGVLVAVIAVCVLAPVAIRSWVKESRRGWEAHQEFVNGAAVEGGGLEPLIERGDGGFRVRGLDGRDVPGTPGEISRRARDAAREHAGNPEEAKRIGLLVENAVASLIRSGYLKVTSDAKELASATGLLDAMAALPGGGGPETPEPPQPPEPAIEPRGTVLVVSDLTSAGDETRAALARISASLRHQGLRLIGAAPGNKAEGEELERQRDLASQARKALGLVSTDSPEAAKALAPWIAKNDDIDAVVWIVPSERDATRADVRVFGPDTSDRGNAIVRTLRSSFRPTPR